MSKEHAYAYEAGYHDGATHYELDHCPSCKNLADLQDALDENAKLRDERDRMYKANVEKNGEILRLLEENAELRELCVGFWQALKGDTQDCPLVICEYMYECSDDECVYERMMQELGIEVDW